LKACRWQFGQAEKAGEETPGWRDEDLELLAIWFSLFLRLVLVKNARQPIGAFR